MKKKVIAAMLVASMAVACAACGSTAPAPAAPAAPAKEEKAEPAKEEAAAAEEAAPDFKGVKAEIDVDGSIIDSALVVFEQMVADFNAQTGAQLELVENGNDHETIMKTRMASNDMPDMFTTHGWSTIRYNEFCYDLAGESWVGDLADAAKAVVTDADGKVCSCPLTEWVYGMPYNKTIMESVGVDMNEVKTWDDLEEVLQKVTDAGYKGIAGNGKSGLGGYLEECNVFYTNDGAMMDAKAALQDGSFSFVEHHEILDRFASLYDNGYFIDDLYTCDADTARNYVATGDVAMMIWGSPEWVQIMKNINPDNEFGIIPVPAVNEGGKAAFTVGEGTAIAISNESANVELCKAFLNYLTDPANLKPYIDATGAISGFSTISQDDNYSLQQYAAAIADRDDITYSNFFDRQYLPSGMWNYMAETVAQLFDCKPGESAAKAAPAAEYLQNAFEELYATNNQ